MTKKCKTCLHYNNNKWSCEEKNICPLDFYHVHYGTNCKVYQNKYKTYIIVTLVVITISLIASFINL